MQKAIMAVLLCALSAPALAENVPSALRATLGGIEHTGDPGCPSPFTTCWIYTGFKAIKNRGLEVGGVTTQIAIATEATEPARCIPVAVFAFREVYPEHSSNVTTQTCAVKAVGLACRGTLLLGSWVSPDPDYSQPVTCAPATGILKGRVVGHRVSRAKVILRLEEAK